VLRIAPSGESFSKIDILTPEIGYALCLQRISKKNPLQAKPDLFDTAEIQLENSRQGTARFVKEYRLLQRRSSIGQSYKRLRIASEFCNLITQNAPLMGDPETLFSITERTLNAFEEGKSPEIILLKSIYLLLRDEGYPVKESWWPQLPVALRNDAKKLINEPTPETAPQNQLQTCTKVSDNLRTWLNRETDLQFHGS